MCRAIRRVSGGIALALVWACQSPPLVESGEGFRHARQGWSIAAPSRSHGGAVSGGPGSGWTQVSVPGSLIAYRQGGAGAAVWMTLSSRCSVSLAEPRLLARHLRIGIPETTVRDAAPVSVGGAPGWEQRFDARDGATVVRLKTVTTVVEGCALDWVLSVGGDRDFGAAERDFDAWWQSFRPGPGASPGEVS